MYRSVRRSYLALWSRNSSQTHLSERQKVVFSSSAKRCWLSFSLCMPTHKSFSWEICLSQICTSRHLQRKVSRRIDQTRGIRRTSSAPSVTSARRSGCRKEFRRSKTQSSPQQCALSVKNSVQRYLKLPNANGARELRETSATFYLKMKIMKTLFKTRQGNWMKRAIKVSAWHRCLALQWQSDLIPRCS